MCIRQEKRSISRRSEETLTEGLFCSAEKREARRAQVDSSRKVLSPEAGEKGGGQVPHPPHRSEDRQGPQQEWQLRRGTAASGRAPAAAQAEGMPRHLPSSRTRRLPPVLPTGQPDRKPLVRGAWGPWSPNTERQECLQKTLRASEETAQSIAMRGTVAVSHSASLEGEVWHAGLRRDTSEVWRQPASLDEVARVRLHSGKDTAAEWEVS